MATTTTTKIEYKNAIEINWIIEDLNEIRDLTGHSSIVSPKFLSNHQPEDIWQLRVADISGSCTVPENGFRYVIVQGSVRIFLKLVEYGHPTQLKIKYKCDASLTYTEGANIQEKMKKFFTKIDTIGTELPEIELFDLYNKKISQLKNVHIKCLIFSEPQMVHFNPLNVQNKKIIKVTIKPEELKLNQNSVNKSAEFLEKILKDSPNEIEIICKEKIFQIHKFLLTAQSEVFTKMLDTDLSEKQNKRIVIVDFEPEIVQDFLYYLEKMLNPHELQIVENAKAKGLFMMSHKYQVEDLKTHCEALLCQQINPKNAIEMLELGKLYNSADLENSAMKFIISKKRSMEKFKAFDRLAQNNPDLLAEIQSEFWENS